MKFIGYKIFLICFSVSMSFFIFSLIPRGKCFLSDVGRFSVYPFSGHTFLLPVLFSAVKYFEIKSKNEFLVLVTIILLSIFIAWLFSREVVRNLFRKIVEPKINRKLVRNILIELCNNDRGK